MKKILLLGSTGSIGINTLSVLREFKNDFSLVGVSTNTNIDILSDIIDEFKVQNIFIADENKKEEFQSKNKKIKLHDSLIDLVENTDFDILVNALVGYSGFLPTVHAIKRKKTIALANKETLVVGGEVIMPLAKENNVDIIPIDSEHSAIFQIINNFKNIELRRIILTASGGPFYKTPIEEFENITIENALKHPTWSMGKKITIDSATMMNKGFEVIEAHHLFNIKYDKIDTIIHPQSIIHSMVEFIDGEIYAQMGVNDMRLPIQHALTHPHSKNTPFERLNLLSHNTLNFFEVEKIKFPMLMLAYECGKKGGLYPCVLNAANEICVDAFLNKKISFTDISKIVGNICRDEHNKNLSIDSIIECDKSIREITLKVIENI